jgi:LysM repeat protein
MMKNLTIICLLTFICLNHVAFAQKSHTVGPKETFYSIGRDYQVHPRELAEYNKMDLAKGLSIGQVIKIPTVKKMKPVEKTTVAQAPVLTPIYHTLKKQENLFQVRMQYNKVPMDSLKKWNNLTSDNVKEGTRLIVGYSTTATASNPTPKAENTKAPDPVKIVEPVPATQPVIAEKKETETKITPETISNPVAETTEKAVASSTTDSSKVNFTENPIVENNPAPQATQEKEINLEEGFFKSQYSIDKATHEEKGAAASFKSTSGWDDGRYYCLHNNAPVGSIIKITNNANQKSAYAKVLDGIPDLDANKNILVRISKAMAEKLGITSENTEVSIRY